MTAPTFSARDHAETGSSACRAFNTDRREMRSNVISSFNSRTSPTVNLRISFRSPLNLHFIRV